MMNRRQQMTRVDSPIGLRAHDSTRKTRYYTYLHRYSARWGSQYMSYYVPNETVLYREIEIFFYSFKDAFVI